MPEYAVEFKKISKHFGPVMAVCPREGEPVYLSWAPRCARLLEEEGGSK